MGAHLFDITYWRPSMNPAQLGISALTTPPPPHRGRKEWSGRFRRGAVLSCYKNASGITPNFAKLFGFLSYLQFRTPNHLKIAMIVFFLLHLLVRELWKFCLSPLQNKELNRLKNRVYWYISLISSLTLSGEMKMRPSVKKRRDSSHQTDLRNGKTRFWPSSGKYHYSGKHLVII